MCSLFKNGKFTAGFQVTLNSFLMNHILRSTFLSLASGFVLTILCVRQLTIVALEDDAVGFIIANAGKGAGSELERCLQLTESIAQFSEPRREFADSNGYVRGEPYLMQSPILASLAYGGGACGYASEIGVRAFEMAGFEPRFVQVLDSRGQTIHVVIDVLIDDSIAVIIDPIFGHLFLDSEGRPATAKHLGLRWESLKEHLPDNKIRSYSYEHGIRYTNWEKNFVTLAIHSCLQAVGRNPDEICLRMYFNGLRRWSPAFGLVISTLLCLAFAFKLNKSNGQAEGE